MNRAARQSGFTLIELLLAMAFISVLLLAIALTIIQIGTIYNRGMTLKELNQVSRNISGEIQRNLSASEAFSLTGNYVTNSAGGRICFGQYSYIWNTASAIQSGDANLTYNQNQTLAQALQDRTRLIRFAKVPDPGAIYCARNSGGALLYPQIQTADINLVVEQLVTGDRTLSIHQLAMTSGANATDPTTGQQLYRLTYTLGTGNVSALNPTQTACRPPGDPASDFAYCTVQQFTLVVRAGNRVN